MRGFAALLVVVYHLQQYFPGRVIPGYLAVDLFFALSGFVIALNYSHRLAAGLSVPRFVEARLVRLFPLFLAGWMLGSAKQIVGHLIGDERAMAWPRLAVALVSNLLMLPTPASPVLFPLNGPAWSLFFEMVVNILFALALCRARGREIVAVAAIAAVYLVATIGAPEYFNVGWSWETALGGLARALYSFSVGILIFRFLDIGSRRVSPLSALVVVLMIAPMALALPQGVRPEGELAFVLVLFPLLVIAGARYEMMPALQGTADLLGDLSYPIYAIRWPLIALMGPILAKARLGIAASCLVYVATIVALGYLVARFFDAPVRRWVGDQLKARSSPTRTPPSSAVDVA
ncbi:acyltransferase [Ancylobacter sp. MQZ15Z-1]|uniref:Acyltransferase n=1 Tax=Ancylobacter mangrovi TaxID=2972472 RepID=A0A9X2PBA2_9HYPH|nr:acyltransferase [Ancylobacter mangrovi]MCS0495627.1 acyltransferase [Ancylobacter mangrovi]